MSERDPSLPLHPATVDAVTLLYRGRRMDTLDVAKMLRLPEAEVWNALAARDARGEVAHAG